MNGTSVSNGTRLLPISISQRIFGNFPESLSKWKTPLCHCDFRKIEALKVNKFGRTHRTGAQAVQARCEEF